MQLSVLYRFIFLHKSAMQHHAREVHSGDVKPHQCQNCLKTFSSNHQLTQHLRVHTGEKPYKCSYCDRRFKQLSHVQQHTRLHTGERPYKCHIQECGRAFIQLSNLQQHLRNHDSQMERSKNRPFNCNICGKGFASESSLRTHRLKQHASLLGGSNSQSCPVCHKICVNGEALMEHMRVTHKDPNASGTPSKKKQCEPHALSDPNRATSNVMDKNTISPFCLPSVNPSPTSSLVRSPSNSHEGTHLHPTSLAAHMGFTGHPALGGFLTNQQLAMGHFLVPPVTSSPSTSQPLHFPLATRPQSSFLSL